MEPWLIAGPGTILGELSLRPFIVVSESDSLASVSAVLLAAAVSCVVLHEGPLRVVTERDLAGAWARGVEGEDPIASIATDHPFWAPASVTLAEAAAMMVSLGIRHLVVLDAADAPLGVVAMADLFAVFVQAREPAALYASFAAVLLRSGEAAAS